MTTHHPLARRTLLAGVTGGAALAGLGLGTTPAQAAGPGSWACAADPVAARAAAEITTFTDWLTTHQVKGAISEIGWPAGQQWQALGAAVLAQLKAAKVPTYLWGAAEWNPPEETLAYYVATSGPLSKTRPQAAEPEAALRGGQAIGMVLADGVFSAELGPSSTYSNVRPGRYGWDYIYPSKASLAYLRSRGHRMLRLPVMWERIQPELGGSLAEAEVQRLRQVLDDAGRLGMKVLLGLHNYGRYATVVNGERRVLVMGTPELPTGRLADVWARLTGAMTGALGLAAYEVMNEPHDLPGDAWQWEGASRLAVSAIRQFDRRRPIHIDGYAWSAARSWAEWHPTPWINDANIVYQAHEYFDEDHTGFYRKSYDETKAVLAQGCRL